VGLLWNIFLGIIGAAVASWLFGLIGVGFGPGWLGYLVAGFIGACILIWLARLVWRPAQTKMGRSQDSLRTAQSREETPSPNP
jgi:sugar phosphate permease